MPGSSELVALRKRVEELERRVQALEKLVRSQEKKEARK